MKCECRNTKDPKYFIANVIGCSTSATIVDKGGMEGSTSAAVPKISKRDPDPRATSTDFTYRTQIRVYTPSRIKKTRHNIECLSLDPNLVCDPEKPAAVSRVRKIRVTSLQNSKPSTTMGGA
ncbi:hypothetical protein CLF_103988, partial [Clonorchis sinensis]